MSNQAVHSRRGLQLDRVVLLGRTFEEYRRYFLLEPHELIRKRILDVAGGVSSFCAEANDLGIEVTAFDPIYSLSLEDIKNRADRDLESVYRTIGLVPTYRWSFYKNPEYMRTLRERASAIFFSDFQTHPQRYVAGFLPRLPFADGEFDLTLVVVSSLRIPGPVQLSISPRFGFGNHACDTRRSTHISNRDFRSTAERISSNAAIRPGSKRF